MNPLFYGQNNINVGPLKFFPEICVDRFIGSDLKCSAFFLTHAHTDHLVGLETGEFMNRLKDEGVKIYTHTLTPLLLGSFERYLGGVIGIENLIRSGKMVLLDDSVPHSIEVPSRPDNYNIMVTLFPAGHCPGSVMFFYESENCRVLFTGDCRVTTSDIEMMEKLHVKDNSGQRVLKKIDHLYIDTTFCCTEAKTFPERKFVIKEALAIIESWLLRSKRHRVYVKFPARFSHEYVLKRIFSQFGKPIHVDSKRFEVYRQLPQLAPCFTLQADTQVHFCNDDSCYKSNQRDSLILRMSSMWHLKTLKTSDKNSSFMQQSGRNLKVCYAMHPSLSEVGNIINLIRPTIVTPIVKPKNSNLDDIKSALNDVCSTDFQFESYLKGDVRSNILHLINCPSNKSQKRKHEDEDSEPFLQWPDDQEEESHEDLEEVECQPCRHSPEVLYCGLIQNKWEFPMTPSPKKKDSQSSQNSQ